MSDPVLPPSIPSPDSPAPDDPERDPEQSPVPGPQADEVPVDPDMTQSPEAAPDAQ